MQISLQSYCTLKYHGVELFISETEEEPTKKPSQNQQKSSKKKDLQKGVKGKKEVKVTFTHPWLTCSLKSHSQPILDMDFSANGKFLASCAEGK